MNQPARPRMRSAWAAAGAVVLGLAVLGGAVAWLAGSPAPDEGSDAISSPAPSPSSPASPGAKVLAVGDIACDPSASSFNGGEGTTAGCRQRAVADVVRAGRPDVFIPLGDMQYDDGTYEKFIASYDQSFGDLKAVTRPIPGNHEYNTPRGAGYYQYFGPAAHQESAGTYSYDVGGWHVLAINSLSCTPATPCGPGSEMAAWIAADVAANPARCMMAVWHHPVWSAGRHGGYAPMAPVWNQLNSYGVDLVLTGHDHLYQRFLPLGEAISVGGDGVADPVVTPGGMVQFVVGTGGADNYQPQPTKHPGVAAALAAVGANPDPAVFGALELRLAADSYSFEFVPAAGTSFTDSGSSPCRTKTPATDPASGAPRA